ncbi:MAG: hypothetical protein L6R40_000448 [Gallowayella cf. fulva]|nr:MAG: hypothetical protein L6R40_000448 [Xanthomendoza cf. fulva]
MFLGGGGHQKFWMSGPAGVTVRSHQTLNMPNGPQKADSLRERSGNQPSLSTTPDDYHSTVGLSCHSPGNTHPPPIQDSSSTRTSLGAPSQKDLWGAVHNIETVLPSPAPSDEQRPDNPQALDAEMDHQTSNGHGRPNGITSIIPSTGIGWEGSEQGDSVLRNTESAITPPASDTLAHQTLQSQPETSNTEVVRRMSRQDAQDKKRKRSDTGLSADTTGRAPSNAPQNSESPLDTEIAGPTWQSPSNAVVSSFLATVIARQQQVADQINFRGHTELSRLQLLQRACIQSDHAYLLLHQIYCMDLTEPEFLSQLNGAGFRNEHINGLGLLNPLLLANFQHMSMESINWFAHFPLPFGKLLRKFQVYREALNGVKVCLAKMTYSWLSYLDGCNNRSYPPLVDELVSTLGIESSVLQSVAFRAILKVTWGGDPNDCCYQEADKLFQQNQRIVQQAPPNRSQEDKQRDDQNLIIKYQQLAAFHIRHMQNPSSIGSSLSMAHPQPQRNVPSSPAPALVQGRLTGSQNPFLVRWSTDQRRAPPPPNINTQCTQLPATVTASRTTPTVPLQPLSPDQRNAPMPQGQDNPRGYLTSPPISTSSAGPQTYQARRPDSNLTPTALPPHSHPISHYRVMPTSIRSPAARVGPGSPLVSDRSAPNLNTLPSLNRPPSNTRPQPFNRAVETHRQGLSPQAGAYQLFLPPAGLTLSSTAYANPVLNAIHQYQATSPTINVINTLDKPSVPTKYLRYLEGVSILPHRLKTGSKQYVESTFHVDAGDLALLSGTSEGQNGTVSGRTVTIGSRFGRLRCIAAPKDVDLHRDKCSAWVTANSLWPALVTVIFNNKHVEVRKKIHYGKDLPVDVSALVQLGNNKFSVSILSSQKEDSTEYAVGLETIQLVDMAGAKAMTGVLPYGQARQRIMRRFQNADPDIEVVNTSVVINLCDPYTSRIWGVPMRGLKCRHDQCFDLDTFLETRASKHRGQPSCPDQFRCPICGADARPQCLIKDEFFEVLRADLASMNKLDAKAIVMQPDGSWEVQEEEKTGETGDGSGTHSGVASATTTNEGHAPTRVEVIEID